ncbi:hypothetical protein HNP40_000078 [Mycobacteroides chelonae]|nr:hypothetical protein [Mycobacteroides chelonae]
MAQEKMRTGHNVRSDRALPILRSATTPDMHLISATIIQVILEINFREFSEFQEPICPRKTGSGIHGLNPHSNRALVTNAPDFSDNHFSVCSSGRGSDERYSEHRSSYKDWSNIDTPTVCRHKESVAPIPKH